MKIAVVTCYRDPDYIRARALRASLALIPGVEVITIKNKSKGAKRYLEVITAVIKTRLSQRPAAYILTFRGYEMLPVMRILTAGKPLIFDELVNAVEWFVYEHKKLHGFAAKVFSVGYRFWLKTCRVILADTPSHADASSGISKVDRRKYVVAPVGTDESAFRYSPYQPDTSQGFRVFFYGYMLPLHGAEYVIRAAEMLKDNPNITFLVAGRTERCKDLLEAAQANGAHIEYRPWVPFDELPKLIQDSAVNVTGPFGNTFQSQYVINGKTFQFLASGSIALIGAAKDTGAFVDRVNSLVVPQADAAAIAQEIQWAYDNQNLLPGIAQAGRQLYDQYYSNKVIADIMQNEIISKLKK